MNCLRWLQEHVNILGPFNMPQRSRLPGRSKSEGGHRFPKDFSKKLK